MGRRILIGLIRFYQAAVAPRLPSTCRYTPSCSNYALEAVERHGALRGAWLAARRLLRCHPLGGRGWDPVPGSDGAGGASPAPPDDEGVEEAPGPPAGGNRAPDSAEQSERSEDRPR